MTIAAAFTTFAELETPRLRLRQTRPRDAEALFAIFADEAVTRYYGMLPHRTIDDAVALLQGYGERYAARQAIRWAIARPDDDTLIGVCGFHSFDQESRRAELGYALGRAYWRQGFASEVVRALLAFGFGVLELHRVEAIVLGDNEASKVVLRKTGFTYEGCLRQHFWFHDRYWDDHYFSLLRPEYEWLTATTG